MTDFTGARSKLERAEEHLTAYEAELSAWVAMRPIDLVADPRIGDTEDWRIKVTSPPPARLSLIIGDSLHNFRCTLDHLAMALAIDNGVSPDDRSVSFPVCAEAADFATSRSVRLLRQNARDFIENRQPYKMLVASALTELNYLDNKDKHRLVLTTRMETLFTLAPANPQVRIEHANRLDLEDGKRYATVTYPAGYTGPQERPNFSAALCVDRSNGIGFIDAQKFLRAQLLPFIRNDVLAIAEATL